MLSHERPENYLFGQRGGAVSRRIAVLNGSLSPDMNSKTPALVRPVLIMEHERPENYLFGERGGAVSRRIAVNGSLVDMNYKKK